MLSQKEFNNDYKNKVFKNTAKDKLETIVINSNDNKIIFYIVSILLKCKVILLKCKEKCIEIYIDMRDGIIDEIEYIMDIIRYEVYSTLDVFVFDFLDWLQKLTHNLIYYLKQYRPTKFIIEEIFTKILNNVSVFINYIIIVFNAIFKIFSSIAWIIWNPLRTILFWYKLSPFDFMFIQDFLVMFQRGF